MNIIVQTYGGGVCCRPDTTWERENKDLYSPDFIDGYMYTPVLFARIAKAGKCIGEKFAERYYDSTGYGILLYPEGPALSQMASCGKETELDAGQIRHGIQDMGRQDMGRQGTAAILGGSLAWASCMDHTSILPFPMYNRITLESPENIYSICVEGKEIYSTHCGSAEMIGKAISEVSRYVSIRIGDMIAIELAAPEALIRNSASSQSGEQVEISATFCGNELFKFKIIR